MLLALVFSVLALATLATIALPLLRPAHAVADRGQFDRAVYRDQLKELDRDLARGVISTAEAQAARLEIQRRLLAATGRSGAVLRGGRSPLLAAGIAGFVLIVSGALYVRLGSPNLPDVPFASRGDNTAVVNGDNHLDMKDAAARLRAKLQANPNDGEGWLLYARTQSMLGDWQAAEGAYQRAMALGQNGPDVLAAYGEMLVLSEQGIVSPAAHKVFSQALSLDPKNDVARYYVALAAAQSGDVKGAIAGWSSLAADIPQDSPMRPEIARRVADAAQSAGIAAPPLPKGQPTQAAAAPGPGDAQMQAAAQMPEAQRKEMIRGMVAKLAAEMQSKPNDLQGWLQLGRAYGVLGERDKAADAFQHAVSLKPDDLSIKLAEVEALVTGLKADDPLPKQLPVVLHEIEKVSPNRPEALWYLGIIAAREGHKAEARDYLTRLLKQLPANGEDAKMVGSALKQIDEP